MGSTLAITQGDRGNRFLFVRKLPLRYYISMLTHAANEYETESQWTSVKIKHFGKTSDR